MNKVLRELILGFLFVLCTWIISTLAAWFVWSNQSDTVDSLFDIFFNVLPDWSDIDLPIPNYIGSAQIVLGIIGLANDRYHYIAQFLFLNCCLLILRATTVSSTLLPNIKMYDYCKERPDNFFRLVELMILHGTCSDYMFSGHTATSMLVYMFSHRHKSLYVYEIIAGVSLGGMIFSLLVLRWHYTSDILIAIIIVWLLFKLYKDYEEKSDAWFYFNSLKNLNWRCQRTTRKERTDFSRSIEPVG